MIELENKVLKSERLEFRLLLCSDMLELAELLKDTSVTEPAGFIPAKTIEEFQIFFQKLTQNNTGVAIICNEQIIGYFHVNKYRLSNEEFKDKTCVGVGFVIGKKYQNRGYATEMLTFMTKYLLTLFDVCVADHFSENASSRRVIEKSGYSYYESYFMYFDVLGKEKQCLTYVCKK